MDPQQEIVVPGGQKKERLDLFLVNHVEHATRNKVQRAIKQGYVLVNGQAARPSHIVNPGEIIRISLPKPPPQKAVPEQIPLDIIFEDDFLLVVNKPAGMVTHPAHGNHSGTLVNALLHHSDKLSPASESLRPGIVHRLDKDTSGLLVVAKTEQVHAFLAKQFSERTVQREYRAIVWGVFKQKEGLVDARLGRSKSDRKKIAVVEEGKHAATNYEVVEQFSYVAHVRLRLQTGRTHQIRVHLSHIGHPVFGDPTYGGRRIVAGPRTAAQKQEVQEFLRVLPRQALHAKTLGFIHPSGEQAVFYDSELPPDMKTMLELAKKVRM